MNKTSYLCIVLLLIGIGVCKWHHKLDNDLNTAIQEGDLYIMQALVERIEERDDYINRLETFIITQAEKLKTETETKPEGQVQPDFAE